jgi:hypothetical protein
MSKEDELRDVLNETAKSIAGAQSNPRTWLSWMDYLLERLEEEATINYPDKGSFTDMLSALQGEIRNRLKTGGWH